MVQQSFLQQLGSTYLCSDIEAGTLPPFIEKAISVVDEPHLKDMLFLSTLSACGYAMPHVKMLHGKKKHTYYPNLMTLIVAGPASGKNVMTCAEQLLDPIEKRLEMLNRIVFIPANSSSAAFHELFHANGGQGFILATEIDEMSKIWKKDYCDYSEFLRLAAEHETPRRARVKPGGGVVPVKSVKPKLSILMSGTPGQLKPLLGSRENGLASRFQPYIVTDIQDFDASVVKNCDRYEPNDMEVVFAELSGELLARWEWLSAQDHDCIWALTPEQEEIMSEVGIECYRTLFREENYTESGKRLGMPISFAANYKRTLVTVKRIGMILSTLRLPITPSHIGSDLAAIPASTSLSSTLRLPITPSRISSDLAAIPASSTLPTTLHLPTTPTQEPYRNSPPKVGGVPAGGGSVPQSPASSSLPSTLYCSPADFRTMLLLFERLLQHSAKMALMLPEEEELFHLAPAESSAEAQADNLLAVLPNKFKTSEAIAQGQAMGKSSRTVADWINLLLKNKSIVKISKGTFIKQ